MQKVVLIGIFLLALWVIASATADQTAAVAMHSMDIRATQEAQPLNVADLINVNRKSLQETTQSPRRFVGFLVPTICGVVVLVVVLGLTNGADLLRQARLVGLRLKKSKKKRQERQQPANPWLVPPASPPLLPGPAQPGATSTAESNEWLS